MKRNRNFLHKKTAHFSGGFFVFGIVLIATSAVLLLLPWKLHHRFAQWATPFATQNLKPFAAGSIALGALLLFALIPV